MHCWERHCRKTAEKSQSSSYRVVFATYEYKTPLKRYGCGAHSMCCLLFLLVGHNLFDTDSRLNSDSHRALAAIPSLADLSGQAFGPGGKGQIDLLVTSFIHKGKVVSVNVNDFPNTPVNDGDGSSLGGIEHVFVLFSSEDVDGCKVTLCGAMLSRFGNKNLEDIAGLSLDHDVSVVVTQIYLANSSQNRQLRYNRIEKPA